MPTSKKKTKAQKKGSSKSSSKEDETKMTPTKRSVAVDDSKPASSKKKRNSKKTSNDSTTKKPVPIITPTKPPSEKTKKNKNNKKKKRNNKEMRATSTVASTPPSTHSERSPTSLLGEAITKLKMGSRTKSPVKKIKVHRPVNPSKQRPAHAINWKTERGLNDALMCNYPTLKKNERKLMSYKDKLAMLVSLYGPKELLSVFGLICVAKGVDFEVINVGVEFATRAKASKIFVDTCMIADEVLSVHDNSDDDDSNRYVFIFSNMI